MTGGFLKSLNFASVEIHFTPGDVAFDYVSMPEVFLIPSNFSTSTSSFFYIFNVNWKLETHLQ